MNALRILMLCLAAAMVCAAIRSTHPQIASSVALAAGVAAMSLSVPDLKSFIDAAAGFEQILPSYPGDSYFLVKMCGIALLAEFASDICRDSGEGALSRRIDMGVKIAMLAAALPMATELMESLEELLP